MDSTRIFLLTSGTILKFVLGLIYFYLIRVYFDIEVIGYYSIILSFFLTFSFILDFGFSMAHLKHFPEAKNEDQEARYNGALLFFRIIQFSCYIMLLLILIPIIYNYIKDIRVIILVFIGELFNGFKFLFNPLLLSKKFVIKYSIPYLVAFGLKIIFLLILINFVKPDLWLLVNIYFTTNLVFLIFNLYFLKSFKFKKPSREYLKKYLYYALPYSIIISTGTILHNIDVLLLSIWIPVEEIANYYTAKQFYGFLVVFSIAMSKILINTFSKNIESGNNEKNLKLINETHKYLNLFVIPLFFLIALYSTELFVFFLGEDYRLTGIILIILSVNLILLSVNIAVITYFRALGKIKLLAINSIIEFTLSIILMIIFISPFFLNMGAIGAAISIILAKTLILIITRPYFYKKWNISFYWGSFRNLVIMGSIFLLQIYINHNFSYPIYFIPFFIFINLGLYFFLNYIFKGFSKNDLKFILNIISIKNIKEQLTEEIR